MASAARELEYKGYRYPGAVSGSSAYELDWEDRQRELTHAGEAQRYLEDTRRQERAVRKVHEATRVQVREAQHVSVTAVLGVVSVLVLSFMVLASYISLTKLSAETVELQSRMTELETENVALTAQYQQMFDLTTVKEVARAAGMDKPIASQVCTIDLSGGDTAVVYHHQEPGVLSRVLASAQEGLQTLVEYFQK